MKKPITILSLVLGITSIALIGGYIAHAQSTNQGAQALEIAPPVITLEADPGETITTQIGLRDVSNGPLIVTGEVNDFVAEGEGGVPKILLEDDETIDNPYSIKDWIDPLSQLELQPQEIEDLPVTIRVPANAAPGGYFGVVRFTAVPPELEGTGVSLSASLGSLLFITVRGDAKESMEVVEFYTSRNDKATNFFESKPVEFNQRIKNTGNIHLKPSGIVTIKDMFGNQVAGLNINLPPGNVLPGSIRKFTQSLDKSAIGNKILFGYYSAELVVNYGEDNQSLTAKTSFWVIPYKLIGLIIVLLVVGFFVLRSMIRRYNRHIIKQANRRR